MAAIQQALRRTTASSTSYATPLLLLSTARYVSYSSSSSSSAKPLVVDTIDGGTPPGEANYSMKTTMVTSSRADNIRSNQRVSERSVSTLAHNSSTNDNSNNGDGANSIGIINHRNRNGDVPRKGDAIFAAQLEIHWPLAFATRGGGGGDGGNGGGDHHQHHQPRSSRQRVRMRGPSMSSADDIILKAAGGLSRTAKITADGGSRRQMSSSNAALASFDDDFNNNTNNNNSSNGNGNGRPLSGDVSYGNSATILPFKLADIGEGIKEVELLQWFVHEGDGVRQFDKVCEVQSDKATVEITSRYDGVVGKLHWKVGDTVQTGSSLMDVVVQSSMPGAGGSGGGGGGGGVSRGHPAVLHTAPLAPPHLSVPSLSSNVTANLEGIMMTSLKPEDMIGGKLEKDVNVQAAPAVRRLAREYNVNLNACGLTPTGPKRRIMKADLLNYVAALQKQSLDSYSSGGGSGGGGVSVRQSVIRPSTLQFPSSSSSSSSISGGGGMQSATLPTPPPVTLPGPVPKSEAPPVGHVDMAVGVAGEVLEIKGVRKAMMAMMTRALEVPHMVYCDEIVMDKLVVLRDDLRKMAAMSTSSLMRHSSSSDKAAASSTAMAGGGMEKISYLPIIVKAASYALGKFPILNSSVSECSKKVMCHADHNIGIAMDTPKGLLVPCLKEVQKKSILQLAAELAQLQKKGSEGRLSESDLSGTTFTLSNIGSIGGTYTSPVIMHPQVAIGAMGRMQTLPRYIVEFGKSIDETTKVVPQRLLHVSWGADHRVIDGSTLARFSNTFKWYVENPAIMLAEAR